MFNPTRVTEKKDKKKKKKKASGVQSYLDTGRTESMEAEMHFCKEELCILKTEQMILDYLIENPESVTLTALDLQRYDPNRYPRTWWWCHPDLNEMWYVDEDMPKAEDYQWGNWKEANKDVERYVMDRAKWRLPHLLVEISEAEKKLNKVSGRIF